MNTNKWEYVHRFDEYFDFEKELFTIPDEGNTSIAISMTFNVEARTCYYIIRMMDDKGEAQDWDKAHYVSWDIGLAMLGNDVDLPLEMLDLVHE